MARNKAPRPVRRAVGGKLLAEELLSDDSWALLTATSFAIVEPGGEEKDERHWHEFATGEWEGDRHIRTVTWVDGSRPTRLKTVDESPITFPRIFKERVDASVVYSETLPVPGGELRGALRRTPAGELISQISSDAALQSTPDLEKQITELEQKLWEFVGI